MEEITKKIEKDEKIEKSSHIRGLEDSYIPSPMGYGIEKQIFSKETGINIDTLYRVVKSSPEVTACLMALIEDILSDGWRYDGSKFAKRTAYEFQIKTKLYKLLANALLDLFITGNAYILKLSVNEKNIKSLIKNLTDNLAKSLSVDIKKKIKFDENKTEKAVYDLISQDISKPKDLQLLKSSTIRINYDETGLIKSYEQKIGGRNVRIYKPEDVIHLSLFNVGGQPYGFTPLETALSDIATLIFAKEFAGKYFENDGIPYFIFHMPNANPGDRNYENLKRELKEMKKEANKYRSMVLTGDVTAEQVNKFNKDMEFSKLIEHFTQIVLMIMGVPAHRVNLTIDVRQIGGAVNRAYEGYFKKLQFIQTSIEEILNSELWNDFNVEMRFNKVYKIDEMREATVVQILGQNGFITVEEGREMMGMTPEKPEGTEINSKQPLPDGTSKADLSTNQRNQQMDQNNNDTKIDNNLK